MQSDRFARGCAFFDAFVRGALVAQLRAKPLGRRLREANVPDFSPKGAAMPAPDLFNDHCLTSVLLILAFISFAIGGTLPVVGESAGSSWLLLQRDPECALCQSVSWVIA